MMLKRLLVLDGVVCVCRFQDDGTIIDMAGMLPEDTAQRLAQFAQWYRRMVSGNTDLFSLFSQMGGWTPSRGWVVRGTNMTVCGMGNLACMLDNEASINEILSALDEAARS
ncbi:DUF2173 family protein [Sulfurirhabdus autotrophica]|nr:DUF2173 family protein [Sulfurirhabdus autotrophica]